MHNMLCLLLLVVVLLRQCLDCCWWCCCFGVFNLVVGGVAVLVSYLLSLS